MRYKTLIQISRSTATVALLATCMLAVPAITAGQGCDILEATLLETGAKTQEVTTEQIRRLLKERTAVLIDSRKHSEYVAGHIPGALNPDSAPSEAVAAVERLVGGDKSKALVLYCNGPFCKASRLLAEQLVAAGFTNVRRYQLGIPIWRALGGPTEIELEGIVRILNVDRTAVFFDARSAREFASGSLPTAFNVPADQLPLGVLDKAPLPVNDFNTRIVIFGRDGAQARALADAMSHRPWHNVTYYQGDFNTLRKAVK
jgi:rhodanese-related sulfurtransferase